MELLNHPPSLITSSPFLHSGVLKLQVRNFLKCRNVKISVIESGSALEKWVIIGYQYGLKKNPYYICNR